VIVSPRREHSRKPDEAYGLIERLVPGPYLELFARQSRADWDSKGDEAGLFDQGPVKTRNRPSNLKGPTSPMEPPLAFRVKPFCQRVGICASTFYKYVTLGKIHIVKIGGRTLVPAAEVQRLLSGGAE
jgi:hypothetical protein